jgi:hypothetical protein
MKLHVIGALSALALGVGLSLPSAAQQKPTIAIMPTQYFTADAQSAENITRGLAQQFEGQGYTVMGQDQSKSTWTSMSLDPSTHYSDRTAIQFGRQMGSDLVAYPRLLALGLPINGVKETDFLAPNAVVHLRVINVHTGKAIYFRQIGHNFNTDVPVAINDFQLPEPVATAAASHVSQNYFERVAGSRQEMRR